MTLFSRYALASVLFAVASCNDPAGPTSSTLIGDNLIRLTTSASAREITAGSPVTLRVSLTNEGAESVTLHFGSSCQILPYVRDARGAGVIPQQGDGYACLGILTHLTLAPGQSEVHEYVWTGSTRFLRSMSSPPELPLMPPGRYYFTAEVSGYAGEVPGRMILRSEPLEIVLK